MCYAGGPYCDNNYGKKMVEAAEKVETAEGKLKVATNFRLAAQRQGTLARRDIPSKYLEYADSLNSKREKGYDMDYEVEQAYNEAQSAKMNLEIKQREHETESEGGIEAIQAAQLSREVQGINTEEQSRAFSGFARKKHDQYHNNAMRETLAKHAPHLTPKEIRERGKIGKFRHRGTEKSFSYSHPEINNGEPFFTEEAKPKFSQEDLTKIGQKAGSTRVIYHNGSTNVPGYLVSDGTGKMHIVPDTINGDLRTRPITPGRSFNARPTDAPGTSHSPHKGRATTWDNASKSKTRAPAASAWESYKKDDDTPQERELRGKVFNAAYEEKIAQKKYDDVSSDEYQIMSEHSRDMSVGAIGPEHYKAEESKSDKRVLEAKASLVSARFTSQRMRKVWEQTEKGKNEGTVGLSSSIGESMRNYKK